MKLKDKIVVIIGATGVIGESVVKKYSEEGARLIVVGRSEDKLKEIEVKYSDSVVQRETGDIASVEDIKRLRDNISKTHNHIDVLVVAAGIYGEISGLEESDPLEWSRAIEVNLLGPVWTVNLLLPLIKKSKNGKIILFAGGGEGPLPNFSSYVSSKAGLLRFVETASAEIKDFNIEINALSPGLVNSGFVKDIIKAGPEKAGKEKYEESLKQIKENKDVVSPDRAAGLVVFLGSDESDGITGKYFSAIWDNWEDMAQHKDEIMNSDIYNIRRIKPKDRGYGWK